MKIPAFAAFVLSSIAVDNVQAQTTVRDTYWRPWYGCWQSNSAPEGEILCVVPDDPGVRMITLANGVVRADTRIAADARPRRSDGDGCTSTETALWSRNRERVFLTSETSCDQAVTRTVRGMLAFVEPNEWLSVQTVTGSDGPATRVIHFTRVDNPRIPTSIASALRGSTFVRTAAIAAINENDVSEALNYIDAAAVQEWLQTVDAPFDVADGSQARTGNGSVLDQIGRMSRDARYAEPDVQYVDRDVVRIVERPVYVVRSWGRPYSWCWTPWGYDYYGWRSGPYIRISLPVVINRGYVSRGHYSNNNRTVFYGRDRGRDGRGGYSHDGRGGYSNDGGGGYSYDGRGGNSNDGRGGNGNAGGIAQPRSGSVTRTGYSSGDRTPRAIYPSSGSGGFSRAVSEAPLLNGTNSRSSGGSVSRGGYTSVRQTPPPAGRSSVSSPSRGSDHSASSSVPRRTAIPRNK